MTSCLLTTTSMPNRGILAFCGRIATPLRINAIEAAQLRKTLRNTPFLLNSTGLGLSLYVKTANPVQHFHALKAMMAKPRHLLQMKQHAITCYLNERAAKLDSSIKQLLAELHSIKNDTASHAITKVKAGARIAYLRKHKVETPCITAMPDPSTPDGKSFYAGLVKDELKLLIADRRHIYQRKLVNFKEAAKTKQEAMGNQ